MHEAVKIIILAISAYLFGNINVALAISKLLKKDVRSLGSGNPGTMNMVRNFGVKIGTLTLVLDVIKGALPTLLGWLFLGEFASFSGSKMGAYIGAAAVITGHIFPIFLKFRGGKGIASTIGIGFVLQPLTTSIAFIAAFVFLLIVKLGFISSFIAITAPLVHEFVCIIGSSGGIVACVLILYIYILILFAHRQNIIRLFSGKEPKTVIIKRKKSDAVAVFDSKPKK